MELSEDELKGLEDLLIKDNYPNKNNNNKIILKSKLNELKKDKRRSKLYSSLPKIKKNNVKLDVKFKFHPTSLNPTKNLQTENNQNSKNKNNPLIISSNTSKKERSRIVKSILNEIKRKPNYNSPKSSNTNLNLFGELYPGPGDYDIGINDIGSSHNLRYKNLFSNNSHRYKNINKYYERNVGPGSYNLIDNFNYVSYAQNPKVFISSLERPSFINENEINKNVGPGTYNIDSSFQKNSIKRFKNNSFKIENKKEKLKQWLKSELIISNNTNFFDLENEKKFNNIKKNIKDNNNINAGFNRIYEKNIGDDDSDFKSRKYNLNESSGKSLHKKYLLNKDKSKRKYFTNNNMEYKKDVFPIINNKYI